MYKSPRQNELQKIEEMEMRKRGYVPLKNAMGDIYAYEEEKSLEDLYAGNPYFRKLPERINMGQIAQYPEAKALLS